MTLDGAIAASTAMMAAAFVQQSAEHLRPAARAAERRLFAMRIMLSAVLLAAVPLAPMAVPALLAGLMLLHLAILPFFNGPYNGGADRMSLLLLVCLTLAWWLPAAREPAFGYLAMQLLLSYAIAGWVKLVNPAWRRGRALRDVFALSAYPVGENVRALAGRPRLLLVAGWGVILFELALPLAFLARPALIAALAVAGLFHFANACLFGLNRFFWIWIAAYPSILWLNERVMG